jgi:hypothetical protein
MSFVRAVERRRKPDGPGADDANGFAHTERDSQRFGKDKDFIGNALFIGWKIILVLLQTWVFRVPEPSSQRFGKDKECGEDFSFVG